MIARHCLQRRYFLGDVVAAVDLALLDARIEFQPVGGGESAPGLPERLICFRVVACLAACLSEQEVQSVFLHSAARCGCLPQEGDGFAVASGLYEIGRLHEVVEMAEVLVGKVFFLDLHKYVFRLVGPVEGRVASRLP